MLEASWYCPQPPGNTMDVHVDGKDVFAKAHHHDTERGFRTNAGKAGQIVEGRCIIHSTKSCGRIGFKVGNQSAGNSFDLLRSLISQARTLDTFADGVERRARDVCDGGELRFQPLKRLHIQLLGGLGRENNVENFVNWIGGVSEVGKYGSGIFDDKPVSNPGEPPLPVPSRVFRGSNLFVCSILQIGVRLWNRF